MIMSDRKRRILVGVVAAIAVLAVIGGTLATLSF